VRTASAFVVVPASSRLLAGALVVAHLGAGALALTALGRWEWRLALGVALTNCGRMGEHRCTDGTGVPRKPD
jgi:hypothetical protein